jgi:S-adenosylmethionine:tRNA ribosyltransferase-isomerase
MQELLTSVMNLSSGDFQYELPPDRIAPYPLEERDQSRLLVYRDGNAESARFAELADWLDPGCLMVLNNTRVVQARLAFQKETGARIEVFCLQPLSPEKDVQLALGLHSPVSWECLVGNAKKWKRGPLVFRRMGLSLEASLGEQRGEAHEVHFSWNPPGVSFGEVLGMAGQTPLPPYIQRAAEASDKIRYQTVFARDEGSVAAPTAGLHFTPRVFGSLAGKGIEQRYVTLHVGAGTFKPVTAPTIGGHGMHQEQFEVSRDLIAELARGGKKLVCVGTTSMRTLESLYWLGAKLMKGYVPHGGVFSLDQWYPYRNGRTLPEVSQSLGALLQWLDQNGQQELRGETSLIIVPGYPFKMVDKLITNFHQPGSTLLLLVAAFAGPGWKDAYHFALEKGFRFLSYGDACMFERLKG